METYFTVARLRSHTYRKDEAIKMKKLEVMTVEGPRTRFYAYEKGQTIPYGILENSRFHALPQTKVMESSLAATLPDTIEVVVVEPNNPHGLVKVRYNEAVSQI